MKIFSLMIILIAAVVYQICAKGINENMNPFAALLPAYAMAFIMAMVLFFVTSHGENLSTEIKKVNTYSYVLGVSLCLYEFGYVVAYRSGFMASQLLPIVNVGIMVLMVVVGILLYKEIVSLLQFFGLFISCIGILITIKQ